MKELFKNTTTYTKQEYQKFLDFHEKKFQSSYNVYTLFISFLLLLCAGFQIAYRNLTLFFIFLLLFICFIAYRIFHPLYIVKKQVKEKKVSPSATNTFLFYNNYLKVYNQKGESQLSYFKLHRIYETKYYFYLYLDHTYAFLVSKAGFENDVAKDFGVFIKGKMKGKYRRVKSSKVKRK